MTLQFATLVQRILGSKERGEVTRLASEFLQEITLDQINDYVLQRSQSDLFGLVRDTVEKQPSILKLSHMRGFLLELVHWYPGVSCADQLEQEDVHDHFGTIVSRALVGSPYRIIEYEEVSPAEVVRTSEREFIDGSVEVITPDTIHMAITSDRPNALSIRIVFPFEKPWMRIFCPISGKMINRIPNADERKAFDLAYTFSELDRATHREAIAALSAELRNSELLAKIALG